MLICRLSILYSNFKTKLTISKSLHIQLSKYFSQEFYFFLWLVLLRSQNIFGSINLNWKIFVEKKNINKTIHKNGLYNVYTQATNSGHTNCFQPNAKRIMKFYLEQDLICEVYSKLA